MLGFYLLPDSKCCLMDRITKSLFFIYSLIFFFLCGWVYFFFWWTKFNEIKYPLVLGNIWLRVNPWFWLLLRPAGTSCLVARGRGQLSYRVNSKFIKDKKLTDLVKSIFFHIGLNTKDIPCSHVYILLIFLSYRYIFFSLFALMQC